MLMFQSKKIKCQNEIQCWTVKQVQIPNEEQSKKKKSQELDTSTVWFWSLSVELGGVNRVWLDHDLN